MATPNPPKTLLDVLRGRSAVDCDTFDVDVAKQLGPFVDCTSNQAIAYHELSRLNAEGSNRLHAQLIRDALDYQDEHRDAFAGLSGNELAVEAMMVKLALRIVPCLTGFSHIQTNPKHAYDRRKMVENGKRIVALFRDLDPAYDVRRVCIKIPATWEGMQACCELEEQGIATLATTMFSLEQAAVAARAGCTYIAPYVNELRVHFDEDYIDEHKAFGFCGDVVRYYDQISSRTPQVLPASLTSIGDVMKLAGVQHITVSPPLLAELAATPADTWGGEVGTALDGEARFDKILAATLDALSQDEPGFRMAFTRSQGGIAEGKIIQALNIFCDKQDALERLAEYHGFHVRSPSEFPYPYESLSN